MSIKDVLRLYRPLNAVMGGIGVIVGAIIAGGIDIVYSYWLQLILGYLVAVFFAGAGNALNDYMDVDVDSINHPHRPIPSGKVSRKTALYLSAVSFILAFLLTVPINIYALSIISISIILMIAYEARLKSLGLPGNTTISFITSASFLFGGAIVHNIPGTLIFFTMSFLSNLGREIIKDAEDMKGDVGRKTLPMIIGQRKAIIVAGLFVYLAIILSPLPVVMQIYKKAGLYAYIIFVILADILFVHSTVVPFRYEDWETSKKSSLEMKIAMLFGLLAFLLGSVLTP